MSSYQPEGWHTIVPRLIVDDVPAVVDFLRQVFGASGNAPDGRPAELRIGDSLVMVSDGDGQRERTRAFLYVYVPDVDLVHARAVAAGARSDEAPADMPYGDRRAMVTDPWGTTWQVATHGASGR